MGALAFSASAATVQTSELPAGRLENEQLGPLNLSYLLVDIVLLKVKPDLVCR